MTIDAQHQIGEVDGIRLIVENMPSSSSVAVGVWIAVGSRHEALDQAGYAHFIEHMLFKGNERIDARGINEFFDAIGSDANAATTKEYTVVNSKVLPRHLDATLGMLGEMVLAPAFQAGDLASEQDVVLEEIAMYDDTPSDVVHEIGDRLVFGDHPLSRPVIGTEQSIRAATSSTISDFHAQEYTADQLVIAACGACTYDEVEALVRQRFLAAGSPSAPKHAGRTEPDGIHGATLPALVMEKETEQVHLCVGATGLGRRDDRRYAALVLDTLLGGTPSSRLFHEVREERGLAYSVYSYVSHYADSGEIGLYLGVRPERFQEALEVVGSQLDAIRTRPPDDAEVERAKDHLEGRMLLALESTAARGNRLGSLVVTGMQIEPLSTIMDRIRRVTPDEVRTLAIELLSAERLRYAVVAADAERVAEQLRTTCGVEVAVQAREGAAFS